MGDEAEPVVEDTTKTVEVVEDAAADAKEKTGGEETPKPGTPDKAMQKMQQELGNVTRQLEALQEKKEAGQQLTEAEKAKLAKAEQRLTKIRQFVARPERNEIPSEADDIAEEVLDIREKVNQQEALKTELERTQDRLKKLENERNWRVIKEEYKGLDTDAIWDKALSDALETLGETGTQETVERVASKWFHERCEAAKKRLENGAANNKQDTPSQTSGKIRVGDGNRTAPQLSEADELLALARTLVVNDG
jgi:uncharacterized protein YfkK (UPF0435 family)